jgi:hypothetical protein
LSGIDISSIDCFQPPNRSHPDTDHADTQDVELHQQVAEEEHADEIISEAMDRFRQVRAIMTHGTIDEQCSIVRAFVRKITFDPETRKGTVDFWVLPQGNAYLP